MRITAPKGTQDILSEEAGIWRFVEDKIRGIFLEYDYGEIRTPIFEQTDLFARGIGETTDIVEKEMYTFTDMGGRSMTLRPEGTASVVRAYLEHNLAARGGISKLFYMGPMFRQEKPQAGRFRQFNQFGVEVLGEDAPLIDAEIIALATSIYQRMGLTELEVRLNSVGCPSCRQAYRDALVEALTPHAEAMCESCRRRLSQNPLRVLDCKSPVCQGLTAKAPTIDAYLCTDCCDHFASVKQYLDAVGVVYRVDTRLVRGLDYYSKTVFEVVYGGLGAQNAVCGGGRYDGLVQEIGGPPTSGIGFAAGMERLILTLQKQEKLPILNEGPQVFMAILGDGAKASAFKLAQTLRQAGIPTEIEFKGRSLKAQMKTADKLKVQWVAILGDDELDRNVVLLRKMSDGSQQEVSQDQLAEHIRQTMD